MVRALTFSCVIAVHTISTVNPIDSKPWDGAVVLLHFTRSAFFVLSAMVLTTRYADRGPRPVSFWRRRFVLVGIPFIAWTLIYSAIGLAAVPRSFGESVIAVLYNLGTGRGWFHLYFLLVSLQFYLLFPLFIRLLRATMGRHCYLIAVSALLQFGYDLWVHDPAPTGAKAAYLHFAEAYVMSYQFFLVLGGVIAMHRHEVEAWLRSHQRITVTALVATGIFAEGRYVWAVLTGTHPMFASDVFQVGVMLWSIAAVGAVYTVGIRWADRRGDGSSVGSRWVERASNRSFGVFLVHPLILWALTVGGPSSPAGKLPAPLSSIVVFPIAVFGSLLIVELLRRTPLSMTLTGKPRIGQAAASSVAVSVSVPLSRTELERTPVPIGDRTGH
jgi:peptidoglycan/LPS O-acetylase OafA/YrhL